MSSASGPPAASASDASPERLPLPEGLVCPKCGGSTFKTFWQTFKDGSKHVRCECATCKAFVRYLPNPGGPECHYEPRKAGAHEDELAAPPESWHWVGMVRQADEVWRAVAMAPTLGRCWDCLLTYPGEGDRLCTPTRPVVQEAGRAQQADLPLQPSPSGWVSWHRPDARSPWRPGPRAATEDEAFRRARDMGLAGDWCCLPAGRDPNGPPAGAARRSTT
jgi:hypothetical protein